jgi:hypothetical protein
MNILLAYAARSALSFAVALACAAEARAAHVGHEPAPIVAVAAQPAARVVAEAPLPGPLARGAVIIPFRTENLRIVPAFGIAPSDALSRIGHLHLSVDGAPWVWAHTSNDPVIINGLPAGPHRVLIELADPAHKIIDRQTVSFEIPQAGSGH